MCVQYISSLLKYLYEAGSSLSSCFCSFDQEANVAGNWVSFNPVLVLGKRSLARGKRLEPEDEMAPMQ